MATKTIERAPVAQAPVTRRRATSHATNLEAFASPLVSDAQRAAINAELVELGARELRLTGATETVARKAVRVALRAAGYEACDAREMATEVVRDARG